MDDATVPCDICGMQVPFDVFVMHTLLSCPGAGLLMARRPEPEDPYESNLLMAEMMGGSVKRAVADVDVAAPRVPAASAPDASCVICMEALQGKPALRRGAACGHEFCCGCIETWLSEHTTCPVCIADLSVHGGYKLVEGAAPPSPPALVSAAFRLAPQYGDDDYDVGALYDLVHSIDAVTRLVGRLQTNNRPAPQAP